MTKFCKGERSNNGRGMRSAWSAFGQQAVGRQAQHRYGTIFSNETITEGLKEAECFEFLPSSVFFIHLL